MMHQPIDAFHLPGLPLTADGGLEIQSYDGGDHAVALQWPRLSPEDIRAVAGSLLATGSVLIGQQAGYGPSRFTERVLAAVDAVAARFLDPADPLRATAERALPAITGYHPRMVTAILDGMARDWRRPALERLLEAELGRTVAESDAPSDWRAALDGFTERGPGLRSTAIGPRLAVHVFAGNVPGVAVTAMIRSLLVGSATLGKTASGEPLLAPLFCRGLAEESPELAACLAASYWPGGDAAIEAEAFASADAIVAYGGRDAVAALRRRVPLHARLIEHGPRISFAVVARERLAGADIARATAAAAARAVALFDQQGCVSPHLVYAERGADIGPEAFAALLAGELAALEVELPRGRITAAESAAIHEARATAEFRGLGGSGTVLHAGEGTSWTVIFDPDPAFEPSCLNRVVRIKPLASLDALTAIVAPYRAVLQSVALEAAEPRRSHHAGALARAGATRVTTLERLPWPPPDGHHDGRGPLRELIRWVDLEG